MENLKEFLKIEHGDGSGYGYGYGAGYGDGDGDGSGYGSGDGYGYGAGYGSGSGAGYGDGDGSGYGYGYGAGDGSGYGYGYGDGSGYGYGYGAGYGDGDGDGSGYGAGSGYGYGYGAGYGIKSINGDIVYKIDNIPTIIKHIKGNIAKGFIFNNDFSFTPCYVVKGHNKFAHGKTLKKACEDLETKIFADMPVEQAIDEFLKKFSDIDKKYPAKDFYMWHNRLTGSCEMGRKAFVKDGGYDLDNDMFTVNEFIDITRNAYGSTVIQELEKTIKERYYGTN